MMWTLAKVIFLFAVGTVCHWAVASALSFWGIAVNMMLVFAVAFCALLKPGAGYPLAFLCGLFLDFFSTKLFGNNAFTFTLSACIVCALAERFDFEAVFPQMVTVFCLVFFVGCLNSLFILWFASAVQWPGFWNLLGGAVASALLAPAVFLLVKKTMGKSSLCRKV